MSLESQIAELKAAIDKLTAAIETNGVVMTDNGTAGQAEVPPPSKGSGKGKSTASKVAKTQSAAADPDDDDFTGGAAEAPVQRTYDELGEVIRALVAKVGRDKGLALLSKSGGVDHLKKLDESDYNKVYDAFKAELAKYEDA